MTYIHSLSSTTTNTMKLRATFTSKRGYRIVIEPMNGQSEGELRKKAEQIMRKRGIDGDVVIEGR